MASSKTVSKNKNMVAPSLDNPFDEPVAIEFKVPGEVDRKPGVYEESLRKAHDIMQRPQTAPSIVNIERQHLKKRMTVWERIKVLSDKQPKVLYQNWGKNLDGASLVTAILDIDGRDVAIYGHDFTVRAGSMDATNGRKLADLFELAGRQGIPVVGLNDSAGAFVPAGVGGLDGYAAAFAALRKISGVVPSIMCMFGYNAGGGSYLPRQGSFIIQPKDTFFGLTGPGVVKSALGEDITADELGGPSVHSRTGVTDFVVEDEVHALQKVKELLQYIPDNNSKMAPFRSSSDPIDRATWDADLLLKKSFNSPTGFNTPVDVRILLQQICDHGDFIEFQPDRAQNSTCAFGRLAGNVVGIIANNSAIGSGQIDVDAAYKNARFIRFCNLYNIPMIFVEDTTGFVPGSEQEHRGIVHAGRAMLDAIIDVRTPRILLIVRNAFGGAYAAFNSHATGADLVLALPTTRLAVMGPAGIDYVYKKELRAIRSSVAVKVAEITAAKIKDGVTEAEAKLHAEAEVSAWVAEQEAFYAKKYEDEIMNPKEALSLGSISQLVMPTDLRKVLAENMEFFLRHYTPSAFSATQREFH